MKPLALAQRVLSSAAAKVGSPELRDRLSALLSISGYQRPPLQAHPDLEDVVTKSIRSTLGSNLYPLPTTRTRWFLRDLETAQQNVDGGDLTMVAQLSRSLRTDGTFFGLINARMAGTVSLPKVWRGNPEIVGILKGRGGTRSVFDEMFPRRELAAMAIDDYVCGISVGEMLPIPGRDYPQLCRLDPEYLRYRWYENTWYYHSVAGPLPVLPGNGRWILHSSGPRLQPWGWGHWSAVGRSWILKTHAIFHEALWESKLANPLRVAQAPQGASDGQVRRWFEAVGQWALDTVLTAYPGYEVKLVESNGVGHQSFGQTIDRSDREYMIEVMGQVVSTQGGVGFNAPDLFKAVQHDLKVKTADALSDTVCTQGLPPWVYDRFGDAALEDYPTYRYDVREPKELSAEATAYSQLAGAVKALGDALRPYGLRLGVRELMARFNVPEDREFDDEDYPTPMSDRAVEFTADASVIATALEVAAKAGMAPAKESVRKMLRQYGIELEDAPTPVVPGRDEGDEPPDAGEVSE